MDQNTSANDVTSEPSGAKRAVVLLLGSLLLLGAAAGAIALVDETTSTWTIDGGTIDADDGPAVSINTTIESDRRHPILDNGSINLQPEILISGQDGTSLKYDGTVNGFVRATEMSLTSETSLTHETEGQVRLSGSATGFEWQDPDVSSQDADMRYRGGGTSVTVNHDAPLLVIDPDTGDVITEATNSGGTVSFSLSDQGSDWTEISLVESDGAPVFDESSASPTGDLKTDPGSLSINVSSPDGSDMDVEFFLNGNSVGTDTVMGDGQASTSVSAPAGENDWYAVAEDPIGQTTTSSTFTWREPDTLYVRNESNPSELISDPVSVEVLFFGENQVYNRTTSDGTIDLSGLPTDERFIVSVDASSEFHSRTVIIDSIYSQQNIYLLHDTVSSVETRFTLDDPTGQYGSESILYIEKAIQIDGTLEYETVYADRFGSEGLTATLEEGERYNLRIESAEGTSQSIGPYRATTSETVQVSPGSPTIDLEQPEEGWGTTAKMIEPSEGDWKIEYVYDDPDDLTDRVEVSVYEKGNQSNTIDATRTHTDLGEASGMFNLTEEQSEKTWVVEFEIERGSETYTVTEEVSKVQDLTGGLSDVWKLVIGVGILFVSAGVFSVLNASVGGVVIAIEAGVLWYTGWLTGATSAAAIVLALFVAVIMHIYKSTGP